MPAPPPLSDPAMVNAIAVMSPPFDRRNGRGLAGTELPCVTKLPVPSAGINRIRFDGLAAASQPRSPGAPQRVCSQMLGWNRLTGKDQRHPGPIFRAVDPAATMLG
ncbi:hypothetical protein GCM10011341_03420 [Frigidibacter albus]|nr:hypothetical protein GCM10011341_03420 [Frigidibacter albus]